MDKEYTYSNLIYLLMFQLKPYAPTLFHMEEIEKPPKTFKNNFPFI